MIDLRFRHFADPKRTKERKAAQFRSDYTATLNKLEYELQRLAATDIVIQAGFSSSDIRNDGWPRSGAKPQHPAVLLHFTSGPFKSNANQLSFPSDQYATYHANLHAIALTLEALRAVDRHGVTKGNEQYVGFAQITAPGESQSTHWAASLVLQLAEGYPEDTPQVLLNRAFYQRVYRDALRKVHPDAAPGRREDFDALMRANDLMTKHFEAAQ